MKPCELFELPQASAPTVQVIGRMFRLLDILAEQPEGLSLKTISEQSGLHASTVHRLLNDLATGHFVERTTLGHYRLGMRLLELGNQVKNRLDVRTAALAPMQALHQWTGQPVNLSQRQVDEIVVIECMVGESSGLQIVRAIGGRAPLHLTAGGKLFLAQEGMQGQQDYAARTGLPGHTSNSITTLDKLERELAEVQKQQLARDNEELELGVRCMGVGIYDDQGRLVAGLSISAPAHRLEEAWLPKLQTTALAISTALGFKSGINLSKKELQANKHLHEQLSN